MIVFVTAVLMGCWFGNAIWLWALIRRRDRALQSMRNEAWKSAQRYEEAIYLVDKGYVPHFRTFLTLGSEERRWCKRDELEKHVKISEGSFGFRYRDDVRSWSHSDAVKRQKLIDEHERLGVDYNEPRSYQPGDFKSE